MKYNQKMTKATHQINPKTIITQKISRKFQSNYPKIMPLCFIRKIKLMKTNIIHRHQIQKIIFLNSKIFMMNSRDKHIKDVLLKRGWV